MYIVIEKLGGPQYAAICTDENGENEIFEHRPDAEEYATDCQDPLIIEI